MTWASSFSWKEIPDIPNHSQNIVLRWGFIILPDSFCWSSSAHRYSKDGPFVFVKIVTCALSFCNENIFAERVRVVFVILSVKFVHRKRHWISYRTFMADEVHPHLQRPSRLIVVAVHRKFINKPCMWAGSLPFRQNWSCWCHTTVKKPRWDFSLSEGKGNFLSEKMSVHGTSGTLFIIFSFWFIFSSGYEVERLWLKTHVVFRGRCAIQRVGRCIILWIQGRVGPHSPSWPEVWSWERETLEANYLEEERVPRKNAPLQRSVAFSLDKTNQQPATKPVFASLV